MLEVQANHLTPDEILSKYCNCHDPERPDHPPVWSLSERGNSDCSHWKRSGGRCVSYMTRLTGSKPVQHAVEDCRSPPYVTNQQRSNEGNREATQLSSAKQYHDYGLLSYVFRFLETVHACVDA